MITEFIFHHLGIATRDIEATYGIYKKLGYELSDVKTETSQNVRIGFLSKIGSPAIELVEPINIDSPVSKILQYSGTTPYHTCYRVNNIQQAVEELEQLNFRLLFEPTSTEAMDKGLFCYLFSIETGLIELYQQEI
jgi:methylmalonyl-CoA/ethylmalonyl-CoA epimerase